MKITDVKPGKRKTFYIHIDGEFSFSAYADIVYKYSLNIGAEIDEEVLNSAKAEQNTLYAKNKALDILSRAGCSEKGLYKKLLEKGIDEKNAAEACEYAKKLGYIDDKKLLPDVCLHLLSDKGYGKARIINYLYTKGFERDMIKDALEGLKFDSTDEIIEQIKKSKTDFSDRKAVSKLYQKLLRKGFSFGEIKSAVAKFSDIEIEEEE